ncbi:coat protein [Agave yellow streak virus Jalisco 1]|uniref:Coat protein n=1 Tax=Agave yellow streak virus Jalisco 1 TaxID=3142681 RepID=A0A1X9ZMU1_9VIRU|nr:coat protein [Agave tequilana leaf virus]ARS73025.1 coat protein [Agave tequilana leaf virus]
MDGRKIKVAILTLLSAKVPGVKSEPSNDEERDSTNNILANIFGSIAIIGTSNKVSNFPSIIPNFDLSAGRLDDTKKKGEEIKLGEVIISMLTLSKAATEPPISGLTLRQMCEPFATEAYLFLKAAAVSGVYTNLAKKMTRVGNKEPQVLFDFAKGLPLAKLTRSEASAIQVMHQRLFRTEGAKSVFEAQSNVGENSVEL